MINLSEIASYILEKSNNPNNKSVTYVRGLIWEQLELRSYKKLLNEDINPDDDEIINDESLDSLVQDIDKDSNERDDIDLNLGLKPEPEEELDLEPEIEDIPDAEIEPEVEPIDLDSIDAPPATVSNPTEPTTKTLPGSDIEVISTQQAKELLSYKGKIFTAVFTKKNGERRVMNGLTGVRKFTSGGTLRYSPKEKNVIPVYDLKIGMGALGYRMINVDGLEALKINGKQYKIDHSKLFEIKINNPSIKLENVHDLISEIAKSIGTTPTLNLLMKLAREFGWSENGTTVGTYLETNPQYIPGFYNKLLKYKKDNLQENMKNTLLRQIVKEVLLENRPQTSPERESPDRETITKPDTKPDTKPKRRTLAPPKESPTPRPKAEGVIKEGDDDMLNKIAQRYDKIGSKENSSNIDRAIQHIITKNPSYTREELEHKSEQDLAKILQGLMRK